MEIKNWPTDQDIDNGFRNAPEPTWDEYSYEVWIKAIQWLKSQLQDKQSVKMKKIWNEKLQKPDQQQWQEMDRAEKNGYFIEVPDDESQLESQEPEI